MPFGEEFAAWVEADSVRLRRLAGMLGGDRETAQDLLQETLVRVGLAWRRIDDRPGAYATTTMSRLAWRAHGRRRRESALLEQRAPREPVDGGFARVDDALGLGAAMARLGPRQRAVLVLRYHCDLSEEQIAEQLGCSRGTVKSQASRGLARLRELLGDGAVAAGRED